MVNNLSVGQELDKLANLLDSYNEKIAVDRLRSLGASINETSFLATWTAADIQRVIDPDGIVEWFKGQSLLPRWLEVLEGFRNALVFAPLLMTWYSISQAVMK